MSRNPPKKSEEQRANEERILRYLGKSNPDHIQPPSKKQKSAKAENRKPGRPAKHAPGSQRLLPGDKKYIIICSEEHIEAMKEVAAWRDITIKEVYAEAIKQYLRTMAGMRELKKQFDEIEEGSFEETLREIYGK